jgi:hypothetical protein
MKSYIQSNVTTKYEPSANPPILDKVVFTIDHIHNGNQQSPSTYDVVKFLTNKNIPVTIFMECSDPKNRCRLDIKNARKLYELNPDLVTLAVHSLSINNTQEKQTKNLELINQAIIDVTGSKPKTLSYHGKGAGPESGIIYNGILYARGVISEWSTAKKDNRLNTPVIPLSSVKAAFDFTYLRNLAGLSSTLFFHTAELRTGSRKKRIFDTFVKEVSERRLQALPYYESMVVDYQESHQQPVATIKPCPALNVFTNSVLSQGLRINHQDKVKGIFQVSELQTFLNKRGLDAGKVDGYFGNKTKLAVIGYQINKDIKPDGIVVRVTVDSINSYCKEVK